MSNLRDRILNLISNSRTDEKSALSRKDHDRDDHRYGGDQIVYAKDERAKLALELRALRRELQPKAARKHRARAAKETEIRGGRTYRRGKRLEQVRTGIQRETARREKVK